MQVHKWFNKHVSHPAIFITKFIKSIIFSCIHFFASYICSQVTHHTIIDNVCWIAYQFLSFKKKTVRMFSWFPWKGVTHIQIMSSNDCKASFWMSETQQITLNCTIWCIVISIWKFRSYALCVKLHDGHNVLRIEWSFDLIFTSSRCSEISFLRCKCFAITHSVLTMSCCTKNRFHSRITNVEWLKNIVYITAIKINLLVPPLVLYSVR